MMNLFTLVDTLPLAGSILSVNILAYIGPGPGLSMLTAMLGLIATILLAILAVFSSPLRVLYRKFRARGEADADESEDISDEASDDASDKQAPVDRDQEDA